jgi:hypothetical protein
MHECLWKKVEKEKSLPITWLRHLQCILSKFLQQEIVKNRWPFKVVPFNGYFITELATRHAVTHEVYSGPFPFRILCLCGTWARVSIYAVDFYRSIVLCSHAELNYIQPFFACLILTWLELASCLAQRDPSFITISKVYIYDNLKLF